MLAGAGSALVDWNRHSGRIITTHLVGACAELRASRCVRVGLRKCVCRLTAVASGCEWAPERQCPEPAPGDAFYPFATAPKIFRTAATRTTSQTSCAALRISAGPCACVRKTCLQGIQPHCRHPHCDKGFSGFPLALMQFLFLYKNEWPVQCHGRFFLTARMCYFRIGGC